MLGAIAGDIIGSPFEFNSIKDTVWPRHQLIVANWSK